MKPEIKVLLDRREEIRKTINKLEAEYGAIGTILTKLYHFLCCHARKLVV